MSRITASCYPFDIFKRESDVISKYFTRIFLIALYCMWNLSKSIKIKYWVTRTRLKIEVSTGAPEGKSLPVPTFKFYTKYLNKMIFSLSIVVSWPLFVFLFLFRWPLYYWFFFGLRLHVIPLIYLNVNQMLFLNISQEYF
jgi:hypothetical protein